MTDTRPAAGGAVPGSVGDNGVIVVTGASSGIGYSLARRFACRAARLVLTARRAERLATLSDELRARHPGLVVDCWPADLADPAGLEELASRLAALDRVDVAVLNAGRAYRGRAGDPAAWPVEATLLATNVAAVVRLTGALLPGMLRRRGGRLVYLGSVVSRIPLYLGSVVSRIPLAGWACYAGSKHFVDGYAESLRAELGGSGVGVTLVLPGPVATEFSSVAGGDVAARGPLRAVQLSADACAAAIVAGIDAGRNEVIPGRAIAWGLRGWSLVPRPLRRRLLSRARQRPG